LSEKLDYNAHEATSRRENDKSKCLKAHIAKANTDKEEPASGSISTAMESRKATKYSRDLCAGKDKGSKRTGADKVEGYFANQGTATEVDRATDGETDTDRQQGYAEQTHKPEGVEGNEKQTLRRVLHCNLTSKLSGRCRHELQYTAAIGSGPLERLVRQLLQELNYLRRRLH
jgi:hypothetical protein